MVERIGTEDGQKEGLMESEQPLQTVVLEIFKSTTRLKNVRVGVE